MSDNIYVQESYVNQTEGYRFGDSEVFESFTDDRGELFKSMQKEYGRCESKIYREREGGGVDQIGWVFVKTMRYEDADRLRPGVRKTYVREVWVTLHKAPPIKTVEYQYLAS